MSTLTKANEELFRRTPDECFDTLDELHTHCRGQREDSQDYWERPEQLLLTHDMTLGIGDDANFTLNDWSFSQLCRMANVSKETINRLSTKTASKAFEETLPRSEKPLQLLATGNTIRSVHGVAFTRLWNAELLDVVRTAASSDASCSESNGFWNGQGPCAMGARSKLEFWLRLRSNSLDDCFLLWLDPRLERETIIEQTRPKSQPELN